MELPGEALPDTHHTQRAQNTGKGPGGGGDMEKRIRGTQEALLPLLHILGIPEAPPRNQKFTPRKSHIWVMGLEPGQTEREERGYVG